MALLLNWAVITAACAAVCAVARWVGQHVDDADEKRSQRDWQLMCEALGLEDLAAPSDEPSTTSLAHSPACRVCESTLTEAVRSTVDATTSPRVRRSCSTVSTMVNEASSRVEHKAL